jgi:hypothetical protein
MASAGTHGPEVGGIKAAGADSLDKTVCTEPLSTEAYAVGGRVDILGFVAIGLLADAVEGSIISLLSLRELSVSSDSPFPSSKLSLWLSSDKYKKRHIETANKPMTGNTMTVSMPCRDRLRLKSMRADPSICKTLDIN